MVAPHPLVVTPDGTDGATEGAGIIDSITKTWQELDQDDVAGFRIHGGGAALETLGAIVDPLGVLAAAGVGWLCEHCAPLSEALDLISGDPDAIEAVSQTWCNIAAEMRDISWNVGAAATADTAGWQGQAAKAYRSKADGLAAEIGAMEAGASGVAAAVAGGGVLVGTFRALIRDIVADCIGSLISRALMAAAASVATLGGSVGAFLAWAVGKIGITIGKIAAKISELLAALGELLGRLGKLGGQLGELTQHAARYVSVRAVTMDDLASGPGRWVASGGPDRVGDFGQRSYDAVQELRAAVHPTELRLVDDAGNWAPHLNPHSPGDLIKITSETAKGIEEAVDTHAGNREQGSQDVGG